MVIMKDSEDPPWVSVGDTYRWAQKHNNPISVEKWTYNGNRGHCVYQKASDSVYTGGRLILFFLDNVKPEFNLHDRVELHFL